MQEISRDWHDELSDILTEEPDRPDDSENNAPVIYPMNFYDILINELFNSSLYHKNLNTIFIDVFRLT